MANRTAIVFVHRRSPNQNADMIVVTDDAYLSKLFSPHGALTRP